MSQNQVIALDAMGGDFGPSVVVPAAALALAACPGLTFQFYGDERQIQPLLEANPSLKGVSRIIHTDKVISNDEKPSAALRSGKDSSMRLAIEAVKTGEAGGVVSGGNTGALMATAKMILKCLPGIDRPAIAGVFPTKLQDTIMLDLGANVTCGAEILVQFAVLGSVYARVVKGRENPSVGLLNVGSEDMKGHDEVRAASAICSKIKFPGRFIGFVEGNNITDGTVDVVVTDGFTGNIALKVAEGVASMFATFLRTALKSTPLAFAGAVLASGAMKRVKKRMDHRIYNGGMFLGLNGICIKSHGSMDAFGFSRAILIAAGLMQHAYNGRVAAEIESLMNQESFTAGLAAYSAEGA